MALQRTEEFKRDAVRIALTSGLTRQQASSDPLTSQSAHLFSSPHPALWVG